MSKRSKLLVSLSDVVKDYRVGELVAITPDHVDRWVKQFDSAVQLPLLRELAHVLRSTYFSKSDISKFFSNQLDNQALVGDKPFDFWRKVHFLDIQRQGNSQSEILELFGEALSDRYSVSTTECGASGGAYIYLDDVLFSGGRIGNDLSAWIEEDAPKKATIHILVIAIHRLGEWLCSKRLKEAANASGKQLRFHFWAAKRVENRMSYRDNSEVLWPSDIPNDDTLKAYLEEEERFPFEPRRSGGTLGKSIFSSEKGRQLLEQELLLAGMRILSFCQNPNRVLRPLGFSPFGLGFGSMIVTYRNCPNNNPLALWWGDPDALQGHPFSQWFPLFQRKTYERGTAFDDFEIF